ncbi:hypothetical protein ACLSU7_03265 [Bdellovibrio sp. HCB185ZH]|uniref:hypothetical protein n=1 Tax=Bdellovibrio sp. HCB185ZH TaxID=3394235 RepID=UPI0039A63C2C
MSNKIIAGLLLTASLFSTSYARAEYALGAMIGDPIGFSGRMSLNDQNSVDAFLGASGGTFRGLQLHSTFLFDKFQSWEMAKEGPMNLYLGIGARVIFINDGKYDGDVAFGPRAPVGMTYMWADPKVEFFAEAALILDVSPKVDADLDIGAGARFRF